jgi:N-acetylglucosaminyldiphosphoundecaprenol N-acetyl-beta-D-mannosaminyltransferase
VEAMQQAYPGVEIVGWHSPPFRTLTAEEDKQQVDIINAANPDFLWVGLGAPKQEKWIAAHLDRIHVPVQLGVGAAFNFHSGHIKRAPQWMQSYGLEWLYRVMNETRLIKRYLATNPVFLFLFVRDLLLIRFFRLKTC